MTLVRGRCLVKAPTGYKGVLKHLKTIFNYTVTDPLVIYWAMRLGEDDPNLGGDDGQSANRIFNKPKALREVLKFCAKRAGIPVPRGGK